MLFSRFPVSEHWRLPEINYSGKLCTGYARTIIHVKLIARLLCKQHNVFYESFFPVAMSRDIWGLKNDISIFNLFFFPFYFCYQVLYISSRQMECDLDVSACVPGRTNVCMWS